MTTKGVFRRKTFTIQKGTPVL